MDEAGKKQLVAVETVLLEKFTDLAFDEAAEMRWREAQQKEANKNKVPVEVLQLELSERGGDPF